MRFVRFIISFYFTFVINLGTLSASSDELTTINACNGVLDINETIILTVPAEKDDWEPSYYFRLSQKQETLNCDGNGSFNYSVALNATREEYYDSGFSSKGILTVKIGFVNFYRYPKDYCVLSISNDTVFLSVCNSTCDNENLQSDRLCIKKCCPMNEMLGYDDEGRIGCGEPENEDHLSKWTPEIHENVYRPQSDDTQLDISIYYEDWGKMNICLHGIISPIIKRPQSFVGNYQKDINTLRFRILMNGNLSVCSEDSWNWHHVNEEFCIDLLENFVRDNETSGDLVTLSALRCISQEDPVSSDENHSVQIIIIYYFCVPIASVFLLIVIIVYTLLWDSQNVHGFTILSYVSSLFLLYISLIISVVAISEKGNIYCKIAGVAVHFLFIWTFCWLTAISFDIWWKFRHLKQSSQSKQIKKYLMYCVSSFAVPVVVITIGLLIDDLNERSTCPESSESEQEFRFIAPQYGKRLCAVDSAAQGWYIYFPTGILLGCNALFFGMTVYAMYMHKKSTNCVLEGNCTKEQKSIWLFSKLFVVMGFAWILEFVGWAIRQDRSPDGLFSWLNFVFDTVNLLQAVIIFSVFVCKKRIFVQLWREHMWLRGVLILFVKTGFYEIPDNDRNKPCTNSPTEKNETKNKRFRKTSNQSETSTRTITSKLSSSSV